MSGPCKDCRAEKTVAGFPENVALTRPAPYPGPRCATHHRKFKAAAKARTAERRDESVYGLKPGGYEELLRIQGGHCFICQRATGKTRRLSVDHDHQTGMVRGLLCRPCNTLIGHLRDDPQAGERIAAYLHWPPALKLSSDYIERP